MCSPRRSGSNPMAKRRPHPTRVRLEAACSCRARWPPLVRRRRGRVWRVESTAPSRRHRSGEGSRPVHLPPSPTCFHRTRPTPVQHRASTRTEGPSALSAPSPQLLLPVRLRTSSLRRPCHRRSHLPLHCIHQRRHPRPGRHRSRHSSRRHSVKRRNITASPSSSPWRSWPGSASTLPWTVRCDGRFVASESASALERPRPEAPDVQTLAPLRRHVGRRLVWGCIWNGGASSGCSRSGSRSVTPRRSRVNSSS